MLIIIKNEAIDTQYMFQAAAEIQSKITEFIVFKFNEQPKKIDIVFCT